MKSIKLLFATIIIALGATSLQANAGIPSVDTAPGHGGHGELTSIQIQQDDVSPLTGVDYRGLDTQSGNNR
ncbi:hypothetical protein R84981_001428 [Carnimonas sp. R-84981]|uniref:hypothetical protein n=1 Tax=Carnimonas bestiolae TaxID=3402172 RepID=UPI003EDBE768